MPRNAKHVVVRLLVDSDAYPTDAHVTDAVGEMLRDWEYEGGLVDWAFVGTVTEDTVADDYSEGDFFHAS